MPSPWRYDLVVWFATGGREGAFRQKELDLAQLAAGESVLDVGCGTGTLAIAAARRGGAVHALDPSAELLARARKKARRAQANVTFELGSGEALPHPDASFDVVLSSLVLHHLSHDERRASVRELGRAVKPSGRVLIVDTAGAMHGGGFDLAGFAQRLADFSLRVVESGPIDAHLRGVGQLHYVLATAA
jgi:ubiquinone/menaquinone biosynthesis C-methylase UbiE